MLLVLFVLLIITLIVYTSKIKIVIRKLEVEKKEKTKLLLNFDIKICLIFIEKICIFHLDLNNKTIQNKNITKILKKVMNTELIRKAEELDYKFLKENMPKKKEVKEIITNLNPIFEKLKLEMKLDINNVIFLSFICPIISFAISILYAAIVKNFNKDKHFFEVTPLYKNMNYIKLNLDCIITMKIVHIIHVMYNFLKKKGRRLENERTSNRRTYANCNG